MDIESCYTLGVRLKEEGHLIGAEQCFRRIVDQDPELPDPQHSLGVVLQLQGRLQEAIDHYNHAIALDPDFAKAHYNLANAYLRLGRYLEAVASARTAVRADPKHPNAHWLLGMLLLQQGDFQSGWQEYEWRWKAQGFSSKIPELGRPLWDGSPLAGRTLLIHMEQGRGDMIQFIRYASLAAAKGARVVVWTLPELVALLANAIGVNQVVDREGELPDFDVYAPVQSLPYLLGTTLDTIPATIPYLLLDSNKVEEWQRMMQSDGKLRVGIAWQGAPAHIDDHNRSCPLTEFTPLADLAGVTFYSLQLGYGSHQISSLPDTMKMNDLTDHIHDFSDTAALIANLDLIISVDSALAHLAGALGKTVWTLLPFIPEWRWLLDREDTPWYSSMRLFRQSSPGDWTGVINIVQKALSQCLHSHYFTSQPGIEILRSGNFAKTERLFTTALEQKPDNVETHCNCGVALDALGCHEEAITCYETALSLKPTYLPAVHNMGNSYLSLAKPIQARICFEYAIELSPNLVPAHLALGEIAKSQRDSKLAKIHYNAALLIDPLSAEAFQGIAEIYQSDELFEEAISAYRKALTLEPNRVMALNMLGNAFQSIEQLEEAENCYRQALALAPDRPSILNNLGTVLNSQGRLPEAIEIFHQLLEIDPNYAEGHWNLSLALLTMGEYALGWCEYEWRFKKVHPVPDRNFLQPRWDGSSLSGRTILLHCEQGFGDTLQFVRYVPLVARRGGSVIVECQVPTLRRLLLSLEGVSAVIVAGEPLPQFDCHLPLLSLPLVCGTTLETIPSNVPYLVASPTEMSKWRRLIRSFDTFRVGIVWSGRQEQVLNRKRSCPLELFSPLAEIQNVVFYSLQVGEGTEQLAEVRPFFDIKNLAADIHDFSDSAAIIANLDLVITIDTAVAHLAGAVGAPTWVLLPHGADWRWQQNSNVSAWYPTMRLFRQPKARDWRSVMANVSEALKECVHTHRKINISLPASPLQSAIEPHPIKRVGLAWSGRQNNPLNLKRNCPFTALLPLFNVENVTIVNLQLEASENLDPRLINLTEQIQNFEDTAALITNLDLVISIDTSVAHLAAALGRPTWVLLPHVADWRWSSPGKGNSFWYPEAELFQQTDFGHWDSVIRKVVKSLSKQSGKNVDGCMDTPELISHPTTERCRLEALLEKKLLQLQLNCAAPDAHLDVGATLALLGRNTEAVDMFRQTLQLDSELVAGHLNLAYSLLSLGQYSEGWQHLEWRLKRIPTGQLPPWPMLLKESLGTHRIGSTVLVHSEQGYGDTIMFSRFLPLLADAGYQVVVTVPPSLASLIASIPGVKQVVMHGELLPTCDFQILLLSLPYLFSTNPETRQDRVPYLCSREQINEVWKARIEAALQK